MAKANSTRFPKQLMEVQDLLMESGHVAQFVKDMSLNTDVNLEAGELSGFFFVMQDLIHRIKKAERLLTEYRDGIATTENEVA
ncbi:hypothetical protein C8R31_106128 [Nitrosospira sp. Nsp2]|uniref:hypothetical protein n=1 Tax=Nitrosospira sp. Nsp2 TaxID=136548 RepID=UPI000D30F66D|nr:hypothetical protein [Nitrosospira sp. Nsp2]PTR14455.1 hypothetical protein C8R31_106128 [Nitrosospira sp. Nsp2]